jgi:hypothetical protein
MQPVSVLHLASFAEPVLRSGQAIVRDAATQSAKLMLTILALRLLPVSVIVRTESLSVEWSSIQASMLQPQ